MCCHFVFQNLNFRSRKDHMSPHKGRPYVKTKIHANPEKYPAQFVADTVNHLSTSSLGDSVRLFKFWYARQRQIRRLRSSPERKRTALDNTCAPFTLTLRRVNWKKPRSCRESWCCPWCWARTITKPLLRVVRRLQSTESLWRVVVVQGHVDIRNDNQSPENGWDDVATVRAAIVKMTKTIKSSAGAFLVVSPFCFKGSWVVRFFWLTIHAVSTAGSELVSRVCGAAQQSLSRLGVFRHRAFTGAVADIPTTLAHSAMYYPFVSMAKTPVEDLMVYLTTRPARFRLVTISGVCRGLIKPKLDLKDAPDSLLSFHS